MSRTLDQIIASQRTVAELERLASCICHRCIREQDIKGPGDWPLSMQQMILCPTCGNKRCPKASDHRLACTGSNALGQPGSVYGCPIPSSPDAPGDERDRT